MQTIKREGENETQANATHMPRPEFDQRSEQTVRRSSVRYLSHGSLEISILRTTCYDGTIKL